MEVLEELMLMLAAVEKPRSGRGQCSHTGRIKLWQWNNNFNNFFSVPNPVPNRSLSSFNNLTASLRRWQWSFTPTVNVSCIFTWYFHCCNLWYITMVYNGARQRLLPCIISFTGWLYHKICCFTKRRYDGFWFVFPLCFVKSDKEHETNSHI